MSRRPVLLVGSVNLPTRDQVFDAVADHLDGDVRAVPDGETGERRLWIGWESGRIRELPDVVVVDELVFQSDVIGEVRVPMMAAAPGVDLAEVGFGPFRYAQEARASYEAFKVKRDEARFAADTRLQVSIPTPMMFAMNFPAERRQALRAFERDLAAEITALLETVPPSDVAIQWDVAGEILALERFQTGNLRRWEPEAWALTEATESIARASGGIPEDAMLGIHLCYGNAEGHNILRPRDLQLCVDFANSVSENIDRRLDWIHMPVPVDRDDDAFFAPLRALRVQPETTLHLGVLHQEDGLEGAARRIAAAARYVDGFGVATECGMGRYPSEDVAGLLALHREAARL